MHIEQLQSQPCMSLMRAASHSVLRSTGEVSGPLYFPHAYMQRACSCPQLEHVRVIFRLQNSGVTSEACLALIGLPFN